MQEGEDIAKMEPKNNIKRSSRLKLKNIEVKFENDQENHGKKKQSTN